MLTQERLKEALDYNPETGIFTWKIPKSKIKIGKIAGTIDKGYITIGLDQVWYLAHRLAWFYVYGEWPKDQIDHINGVRDDNRIENLREASRSENGWNVRKNLNSQTGIKNVFKVRNKFRVLFKINGKQHHFGYFSSIEEAKRVADEVRMKFHGEFANFD